MRVKIYSAGKEKFIGAYNVNKKFDEVSKRKKLFIPESRCTEILNSIYPTFEADKSWVIIEFHNSRAISQYIRRKGTIITL